MCCGDGSAVHNRAGGESGHGDGGEMLAWCAMMRAPFFRAGLAGSWCVVGAGSGRGSVVDGARC